MHSETASIVFLCREALQALSQSERPSDMRSQRDDNLDSKWTILNHEGGRGFVQVCIIFYSALGESNPLTRSKTDQRFPSEPYE